MVTREKIRIMLTGIYSSMRMPIAIAILLLLSASVILIPSLDVLFMNWGSIPIGNWLRLASAIILAGFLPGFFVLKLITRDDKISPLATVVLSYLLSMFITPLIYFVATISLGIPSTEVLLGLMLSCVLTSYILFLLRESKGKRQTIKILENLSTFRPFITVHISSKSVILAFVSFLWLLGFLAIYITSQFRGSFFIPGVNQHNFNWGLSFTKGFPWWLFYPWWFHAYLSSFFTLSGFPPINAYLTLAMFTPMTIPLIYLAGKAFLKEERIAALATLFASFQGFGWIYFILRRLAPSDEGLFQSLWDASLKSRDILGGVVLLPNTFAPIFFVGVPTFLALLFIMYSDEFSPFTKYVLVMLFTSLLYLSHGGYEVLLFVVLFILLSIFDKRIRVIGFPLAVLLGLLFVALVDMVSPIYNYVMSINTLSGPFWRVSSLYVDSVAVSLVACIIIKTFDRIGPNIDFSRIWDFLNTKRRRWFLFLAIVYLYVIFWLTWARILPTFDENNVYIYSYPMRFGVNMILGIFGLVFLLKEENRELRNTLSILLVTLVSLTIVTPFMRQLVLVGMAFAIPPINEHRLHTYLLIFASFISAYAFLKILYKSRKKRNLALGAVLTLLITSGLISTIFHFYGLSLLGWYYPVTASDEELKGLNYLRVNAEPNTTVLTISSQSRARILTYTGLTNPMLYQTKSQEHWYHLISTPSPEIVFYLLNKYKVRYIYLTSDDFRLLENQFSGGFLAKMIHLLPVVFRNDHVSIFEVPQTSYPLTNSGLNIVAPLETMPSFLDLYTKLASSDHLQVSSCDTLDFVGSTRAQTTIDTGNKKEGEASIRAIATGPKNDYAIVYFLTAYMPREYQQLDRWETLFFWFKGSEGNITVEVGITTWGKGQSFWRFTYKDPDKWQGIIVPLQKPDGYYYAPADLNNASLIEIKVRPPLPENLTFNIDDLFLSSYSVAPVITSYKSVILLASLSQWNYSISLAIDPFVFGSETLIAPFDPQNDTYSYFDYVERGGKLIIFNTMGHGIFARTLSISASSKLINANEIITAKGTYTLNAFLVPQSLTLDRETKVLGSWGANNLPEAPFVFFRPYGRGVIYYVEALFLPKMLNEGTPNSLNNIITIGRALSDLLPELGTFSREKGSIYDYQKRGLSWFSYTTGVVTITGSLNIEANGLVLPGNLANLTLIGSLSRDGRFSLKNVSLSSLESFGKYRIEVTVLQTLIRIRESESPHYISILTQGPANVSLISLRGGEIHATIHKENSEEKIIAKDLNFTIRGEIILKSPRLSFQGTMSMGDTWIWPGNILKVFANPITLQGRGTLVFNLAGGNFTYISVLDFNGNAKLIEENMVTRNELADIYVTLTSSYGLITSVIFMLLFIKVILSGSFFKLKLSGNLKLLFRWQRRSGIN